MISRWYPSVLDPDIWPVEHPDLWVMLCRPGCGEVLGRPDVTVRDVRRWEVRGRRFRPVNQLPARRWRWWHRFWRISTGYQAGGIQLPPGSRLDLRGSSVTVSGPPVVWAKTTLDVGSIIVYHKPTGRVMVSIQVTVGTRCGAFTVVWPQLPDSSLGDSIERYKSAAVSSG